MKSLVFLDMLWSTRRAVVLPPDSGHAAHMCDASIQYVESTFAAPTAQQFRYDSTIAKRLTTFCQVLDSFLRNT